MTKATRREPARTATPEELAEENRRAEEARLPKPDAEALAAFRSLLAARGDTELLLAIKNGEWLPTQPHEVAAALVVLLDDSEEDCATLEALRKRVKALEQRLDPDADYRPAKLRFKGPGVVEGAEGDPFALLWANSHNPDGTHLPPEGEVDGEPMEDLARGHLRPRTWAELCDVLQVVGKATGTNLSDIMDLQDEASERARRMKRRLRAIEAELKPRNAPDLAARATALREPDGHLPSDLVEGNWAPTSPVEVLAALQAVAGLACHVLERIEGDGKYDIERRLEVLEKAAKA